MKFWFFYLILFITGCALIAWVSFSAGDELSIVLTYEGVWISAFGVVLTFIQVMQLKKTTEATEIAVNETKTQMKLILSVAHIAKNVAELRYVKECITNDKMELARIRLGDVKDFISEIGYIEGLCFDRVVYRKLVNSIDANLYSLEQTIHGTQKVDKDVFSRDIEKVVTFLIDIENKLKSK